MTRIIASIVLFLSFSSNLYADNYKDYIGKSAKGSVEKPKGHTETFWGGFSDRGQVDTYPQYGFTVTKKGNNSYIWLTEVKRKTKFPVPETQKVLNIYKIDTPPENQEFRSNNTCRIGKNKPDPNLMTLTDYGSGKVINEGEYEWQFGVVNAWRLNIKSKALEPVDPTLYSRISCGLMM